MKKDYSSYPPIGIVAYSDFDLKPERRPLWGDYWFKENLINEFKHLNYPVNNNYPGILLHLFGSPLEKIPEHTYNILWLHSHPDWLTASILRNYQKIYCISRHFISKINNMGFEAEWLMIPTNMTPIKIEKQFEITFVGNVRRGEEGRKIIREMGFLPYNIKIWGLGWEGIIPDKWLGGKHYEYSKLNELYSSSKIVLNDHHEDMRREGFMNPRILDVLASGGFVISDNIADIDQILNDCVPTYSTPEELRELIKRYLHNDEEREKKTYKGQQIALKFSYKKACKTTIKHIEDVNK